MHLSFRWFLALGYMGGIFLLSSIPDQGEPTSTAEALLQWMTPELQNYLHIPLFGGLAATWAWALQPTVGRRRALWLALVICSLFSLSDEWHQLHVPGRYASLTDLALNQVGILLFLGYLWWRGSRYHAGL